MAENIRYNVLEEQTKKSDLIMQELTTELRRHVDEGISGAESALGAKLVQIETNMESKFKAYTASMESKLASIVQLLAKKKQIPRNGEGSVDRTPLLPTPGTIAKQNQGEEPKGNHSGKSSIGLTLPNFRGLNCPCLQGYIQGSGSGNTPSFSVFVRSRTLGEWKLLSSI